MSSYADTLEALSKAATARPWEIEGQVEMELLSVCISLLTVFGGGMVAGLAIAQRLEANRD